MLFKLIVALVLTFGVTQAVKCESPKHSSTSFSTNDAFFHYHTTVVAEFALQCANNVRDAPFYAVVDGKELSVAVSEETLHYQVSWSLPNDQAGSQTFDIQIYDEDTFEQYQKACFFGLLSSLAVRDGQSTASIQPLFTISHYHSGVSKKFPLSSETIALLSSLVALYFASYFRTELKQL
ncbi:Signal sequence receptor subunit delta [Aphelenchoides besseyi]|nr:Signal sequence receptor subunit delta [Aphelenchoides besseyi]